MPVFISYSHADSHFVDRLAKQLVQQAVNVWVDRWEISVGESLIDKVEDAIAGASALLVVLSKTSVESNWVKKEVNAGLVRELDEKQVVVLPVLVEDRELDEKQVVVLPVLVEDCVIPTFLREKLFADFRTNFDDGLRKTLEAVARITNAGTARTDAPTFHTDWGLDWGLVDDRVFLRFRFVQQVNDQPYTVLSSVHIILDRTATGFYVRSAGEVGEDAMHRAILETVVAQVGDVTFLLSDQFEKTREFTVRDGAKQYTVSISAQRLGEDTGRDVLVRTSRQMEDALRHMYDVALRPLN